MTQSAKPNIPGYKHLLFYKKGGMGIIYRGCDEKTGEEVIIKLMDLPKDAQKYANYQRRFARETDFAKILEHEHVLAAIGHGDIPVPDSRQTIPYLVYPYIENGPLSNLLNQELWRTWPLSDIADIIIQAAEGLFHLHQKKIVHQDVKLSNFLWSPVDSVQKSLRCVHIWLIDFGTADWEGETEFPIGTPGYVAPEQMLGHIRCSADQYALAVMARLLLTGYHPPQQNRSAPPLDTPLTELNPERLHEQEIDRVVLKALAQRPEDRFASVLDFAQALRKAILQQEHFYEAPTDPAAPPSAQQHNKTSSSHQAPTERESSINPQPLSVQQAPLVIPPILSSVPYQPVNEVLSPMPQRPVPIPNSVPSLPSLPLQKLFAVRLPNRPTLLAWSPDGTALICTFHHDAPLLIHGNQKVDVLSEEFSYGHCACWSPNSRFLAISVCNNDKPQAEIRFWDRAAPKERYQPLQLHNGTPIYGLDWSRTERLALWLESELLVYDLSMLSAHGQLVSQHTFSLSSRRTTLRWSPDGAWLAAGASNGKVICWSPQMSAKREQQPFTKSVYSMSWSPDSMILVAAFVNKQVMFWNLHTGSRTVWESLPEKPTMVSISPQTAQLAIATEKMLFFGDIGDSAPTFCHPGQLHVAWSPTNKLATLDYDDQEMLVIWKA